MHEGARFFKVIGGGGGWGTQSESKLFLRPCLNLSQFKTLGFEDDYTESCLLVPDFG